MAAIGQRRLPRQGAVAAAFAVAVIFGAIVSQSWAGYEVSGNTVLFFVIAGVTYGSVYAVAAVGLVVTYTTSGIFNFAQGAIGMFMAFVFWQLHDPTDGWGIQTLVALLLTVLVAAPLLGAGIERVLMRRIVDAPLVAQLVVTIGLLLGLVGLAGLLWNPNASHVVNPFFGSSGFHIGQTFLPWSRFITIVAGLGVAVALRLLLSRSRIGVAMRAVVDNRELAGLNGVRPGRVSALAWALGSSMAALAGIFLAEELGNLNIEGLSLLIVDAFAAAIIGRLRNLPLTYAGGLIIGLTFQFQRNFLDWGGRWATAGTAIPTALLFLALLFVPAARLEGARVTRAVIARVPSLRRALLGMVVLFISIVVLALALDRINTRRVTVGILTALIMLSLVPLSGWSKQISLAQITFVGVGAFAYVEWSPDVGPLLGLLVAAAFAVPFGILMALPALRLRGLYLALASMAFAYLAQYVFFQQPEILGTGGRRVPSIEILGADFSQPFRFLGLDFGQDAGTLLFITAMFGAMGMLIVALRRGRFGRRLVALGDSGVACASVGINQITTKIGVFAISAAIAGFAGALLGIFQNAISEQDFQMFGGLQYVLLAVVGGIAVVSGALMGGIFLQTFTWLTQIFAGVTFFTWLQRVGPGLAGIGVGRNPGGVVPTVGDDWRAKQADKAKAKAKAESSENTPPSAPPVERAPVANATPSG